MSPAFVRCLGASLTILMLLAAAPAKAEDKKTVQVSLIAILATERDDKIDAKLTSIAREVRKTHKKLTGFHLARMTCNKSLAIGAKETFEVIADQKVGVTVKRSVDDKNRVQVKVAPPLMGEITYDTCCGKFLPIVTPFRTANNDLLIIAVRVQPCHGK